MPRNRRYSTEFLNSLLEDYLVDKCDYRKIKIADLVRYCNEKHNLSPELNYQDFTRNPDIKNTIDKYNDSLESGIMDKDGNLLINQEISVDVRDLYRVDYPQLEKKVSSINEQLTNITQINKSLIIEINKTRTENRNIINEKINIEQKVLELEQENEKLRIDKRNLGKELASEKTIRKKLYHYIEKHINDPIVQQHLVDIGMLSKEEITDETPENINMQEALLQFYSDDSSVLSKEETDILERLNKM